MTKTILAFLVFAASAFAQSHSVTLNWADTLNPSGTTYNIYRLTGTCPVTPPTTTAGFAKINAASITVKTYTDTTVAGGATYCYLGTSANTTSESGPSNTAGAQVPGTFPQSMLQITVVQ